MKPSDMRKPREIKVKDTILSITESNEISVGQAILNVAEARELVKRFQKSAAWLIKASDWVEAKVKK